MKALWRKGGASFWAAGYGVIRAQGLAPHGLRVLEAARAPQGGGKHDILTTTPLLYILLGSAHRVVNEVSVSQQLARRDRHFLHAGNHPERANAAQAPAPLGANLRFDPCFGDTFKLLNRARSLPLPRE
jgi:hypothetical protein